MSTKKDLPHKIPADLQKALAASSAALKAWEDITPLARNEWICWVGCVHRTDKPMSSSQKFVMSKKTRK